MNGGGPALVDVEPRGGSVQKATAICDRGDGLLICWLSITSIDQLPKNGILISRSEKFHYVVSLDDHRS